MKSEITLGARCVAALAICVAMSSCGDDPELVRKRDEQRAEIAKFASLPPGIGLPAGPELPTVLQLAKRASDQGEAVSRESRISPLSPRIE